MKIAFDTETHGLDWFDGQHAFLGSWADEKNAYHANLQEAEGKQEFANALASADTLIAHNFSFDCHQVRETLGIDLLDQDASYDDTDLMARVALPSGQKRESYKLKDLAETLLDPKAKQYDEHIKEMADSLGVSMKKPGGYYEVWRAYPEIMEEYARFDARYTYDLHTKFDADVGTDPAYVLEREVIPVLVRAEQKGVALDRGVVSRLTTDYQRKSDEIEPGLVDVLGEGALGGKGSTENLLNALLEMGVPLYRKTDTGQLQTNQYALQEFEDDFPILATLMEYRGYQKFLSTYLRPMEDRDVIHTSFRQSGAWTSRMSSARPNMQNIPKRAGKEVRSMFVPREGHAFVVYDYDSIEVRLLAYYMGAESYRKLIRDGLDPHAFMAASIHGGDLDEYTKDFGDEDNLLLRNAAKNTMFAITYGAGGPRVADMNKIPKAEAYELIKKIKKSLPGYYKLNKRIKTKIEDVGYVNTLYGRKQPVNKEKAYVGLNALIQGSAAGIMKRGAVNVAEAVAPYGGVPLLFVHDEALVECPIEEAENVARVMPGALTSAYDLDPPLSVEGGIVLTNYADA